MKFIVHFLSLSVIVFIFISMAKLLAHRNLRLHGCVKEGKGKAQRLNGSMTKVQSLNSSSLAFVSIFPDL